MLKKTIILIGIFLAIFLNLIFIQSYISTGYIVNSPDENITKRMSNLYQETGNFKLAQSKDMLPYTQPRGFFVYKDNFVPYNMFGHSMILGTIQSILGSNIVGLQFFILIGIGLIFYLLLKRNFQLDIKFKYYYLVLYLSSVKLWFFLGLTYYNLGIFVFYILISAIFFSKIKIQNKSSKINHFLLGFFMGITALIRYEAAIFMGILYLILLRKNLFKKEILLTIGGGCISFLFPFLLVNESLYGNPVKFGYSVFNEIYFIDERTGSGILGSIMNILIPGGNLDINLLTKNLYYYIIDEQLLLGLVGLSGFITLMYRKKSIYIGLLIGYYLMYQGMSISFGSGEGAFLGSVNRYRILVNLILILGTLYHINKNKYNYNAFTIILLLRGLSFINLSTFFTESYNYNNKLHSLQDLKNNVKMIDHDYIMTDTLDKVFSMDSNIITRQTGNDYDEFIKNPGGIIKTIKTLLNDNMKIIVIGNSNFIDIYSGILNKNNLYLEVIEKDIYNLKKNINL